MSIRNTINRQQRLSNTKLSHNMGEGKWKLKYFVVSLTVVRNASSVLTTATKSGGGKTRRCASKHSDSTNLRETSAPATQPGAQTQILLSSTSNHLWGWVFG